MPVLPALSMEGNVAGKKVIILDDPRLVAQQQKAFMGQHRADIKSQGKDRHRGKPSRKREVR